MQVKKGESKSYDKQLYTGVFLGTVLAVNPSRAELSELFGTEYDAEEIKYEGKNKDNIDTVTISFWLQDEKSKQWFNARFRIVDKVAMNKEGTKTQYINCTGASTWADDAKNLPNWFTQYQENWEGLKEEQKKLYKDLPRETRKDKTYVNLGPKEYRAALQGEADLYVFLSAWVSNNAVITGTGLLIDTKKAFRNISKFVKDEYQSDINNWKEIVKEIDADKKKEMVSELFTSRIVCLATVQTSEKDGNISQYQRLWKEFLPGWRWKSVSLAAAKGHWNGVDKWYENLTQGDYSCKDAFDLSFLHIFDESTHISATAEVFRKPDNNEPPTDLNY